MNAIEIQQFHDGDEARLYEIFHSAVHELACADYTREQRNAWAPADLDLEAWYGRVKRNSPFVAVKDGEIVGFADLQADGYIDQFFVAADFSRQGAGTRLMAHLHQAAREMGLPELSADVSLTAEPFFLRFGFEVVERRCPVRRGIALPNAFMHKRLPACVLVDGTQAGP